jgi:hypothetical protein
MTDEQTPRAMIDAYLKRLAVALGPLPPAEVHDILQEIRGHIEERISLSGGADVRTVERILAQMGEPEDIGSLYRTDAMVAQARATFSPLLIFRITMRLATETTLGLTAFLLGFFGYGIGVALLACAVLKPFFPQNIGLFVGSHGVSLALTPAPNRADDLLGWWVIPFDLVAGALALLGTTVFLRWMLRFARPPSSGAYAPLDDKSSWRRLMCFALVGAIILGGLLFLGRVWMTAPGFPH